MRLALFDDHRLGVVTGDGVVDVTDALPWPHDPDPLSAGWWRRLCRDFADAREALEKAAALGRPVRPARLLAPALNPSKIVASATRGRPGRRPSARCPRYGASTEPRILVLERSCAGLRMARPSRGNSHLCLGKLPVLP
ncbi:hypothetical protein ABGB18_03540 [Nonomuraea sp. B12E4]|uniref:hypothetical protein n=1 Tax=Nonomuraea sp. B12E4 TaxID=3153564 RepID=UPI00325EB7C4